MGCRRCRILSVRQEAVGEAHWTALTGCLLLSDMVTTEVFLLVLGPRKLISHSEISDTMTP